ncbi:MAG: YolD-like family protein [Lachnospiraceae bacterium]|nr:YolD-like family protein [Lachnospiraceae bacterium]
MNDYSNIIDHPHHQSSTRPHMSMLKRAAQFSPFAALTGYGDAVEETGRLTSDRITLDEDALSALNEKLQLATRTRSVVAVTFFVDDLTKSGGTYLISSGRIKKIDAASGRLTLEDGTTIAIGDIFDIRISDGDDDTPLHGPG